MNELLNAIAAEIGTNDKNIVISAAIAALMDQGLTIRAAYEAVFGAGAFDQMAGNLYDAMRA
jgi:alpha/beta superfamily hydrolase